MIHRVEIAQHTAAARLQLGETTLRRGEVLEVETSALTIDLLLNAMLAIDGQTFDARLGRPTAARSPVRLEDGSQPWPEAVNHL